MPKTTIAQIANAVLDGKEAGEEARNAAKLLDSIPGYTHASWDERDFMARAVSVAAAGGITQFVHLGCGYPFDPNVHDTGWNHQADIRVAYVDSDEDVVTRTREWLKGIQNSGLAVVQADFTSPAEVTDQIAGTVDLSQRVCVVMCGLFHHLPGGVAASTVLAWKALMARGSFLVLSQAASNLKTEEVAKARSAYKDAGADFCPRSPSTLRAYFSGIRMIDPGLDGKPAPGVTDVARWGLAHPDTTGRTLFIGGAGQKK